MFCSVKNSLFLLILVAVVHNVAAQNNTISPYSKFGLGLYEQEGTGRNTAMGGTGIALASGQYANSMNPASYASLDSTMVLFDIGLHLDYEYIETHMRSGDKLNGNISYFSLTLAPSSKVGLSFGITPYTSVGYTIESLEYVSGGGNVRYVSHIEGLGGLTRVYLGTGVNLFKNTSLGVNASVLFGPKTERQSLAISASDEFSVFIENTDYYAGGKLDFGLQQSFQLSKNKQLTVGAVASTPGILHCTKTTLETNTFYRVGVVDTIYYDDDDGDRYTTMPATFGAGLSYNVSKRITLAADFNYNPLSSLKVTDKRSKLMDNKKLSLGFEYIPQRVGRYYDLVFRAGAGYESGFSKVDDYKLKSINASFGVGFRIKQIRFNTYCMYKRHGTRDNLLVLDQKLRFGLNLTYIDFWFQKRQYN